MSFDLENLLFAASGSGRGKGVSHDIIKCRGCINRLTVLVDVDTHANCNYVEFESFDGETYAHLRKFHLYTLKGAVETVHVHVAFDKSVDNSMFFSLVAY